MSDGKNDHQRHENKTYQDNQREVGARERVMAHEKRIAWAQKHKPTCVGDWLSYNIRHSP